MIEGRCCYKYFDPVPRFSSYGVCFTTYTDIDILPVGGSDFEVVLDQSSDYSRGTLS